MGGHGDMREGRRLRPAGHAFVAILVALALAAFLNAAAMRRTAREQPFGAARTVRLAVVGPLATVSHWLLLDRPARLTAEALGKPYPGAAAAPAAGSAAPRRGGAPLALPPASPRPTVHRPLRIYVAGDSMAGIPGMALTNLARDAKVLKTRLDYRVSSGLCRPDFFDWPAQIERQVRDYRPGAAVVLFGANDQQGVETPGGSDYRFGSRGWKQEYRRRVDEVIAELMGGGARRVYWIGQPVMPDAEFSRQMRLVDRIYQEAAAAHPGVEYIDAYRLFENDKGVYSAYLKDDHGRVQQVREGDGTHFTYAGGLRLAQVVLTRIEADWLPPLRTTASPSARPSPTTR